MNPLLRRTLSLVTALLVVATLGTVGGYAYAYEPQRDVLTIAVGSTLSASGNASLLSGTVNEVSGGRLRLDTANGRVDLTLPAGARIEELRPLPAGGLTPGTYVNVGVERSESSTAISGIVALESAR